MKMLKVTPLIFLFIRTLALYSSSASVIDLTPEIFDDVVLKGNGFWLVQFYSPSNESKSFIPQYETLFEVFEGVVNVGAVNAEKSKELAERYEVTSFPTFKIFPPKSGSPRDFTGQSTLHELVEFTLNAMRISVYTKIEDNFGSKESTNVIVLTDENFDRTVLESKEFWLVAFYAPSSEYCKIMSSEWDNAATKLQGKAKFGSLDATKYLDKSARYGIGGYPTVKYFPAGSKKSAFNYDRGLTTNEIVNWVLNKLDDYAPPLKIIQITDEETLMKACAGKPVCIISVLPDIIGCQSKCRNEYLEMLKNVSENLRTRKWGWVWTEAGVQKGIEDALGIGGSGYPALAVVNLKKMKYVLFVGSFSKVGIEQYLRDLMFGGGHTSEIEGHKLPINNVDPWDGNDAETPLENEQLEMLDVNSVKEEL